MCSGISAAEDAFAVLANRIRLQILQTLGETSDQTSYSFTELYEAVDISNTSQFSYHLNELTDQYVQQTDGEYVISDAGLRIVQSVSAGEYTARPEFESISVSTCCPYCGETSGEATYDQQLALVGCLSCENTLLRYDLRPAHVDDRDQLHALKAADRQMRAELRSALDGVCQRCGGSVEPDFHTGADIDPAEALVVCECQQCGTILSAPISMALLHHPEVISRYWNENVNVMRTPTWKMFEHLSTWSVELTQSESITVTIPGYDPIRIDLTGDNWIQTSN